MFEDEQQTRTDSENYDSDDRFIRKAKSDKLTEFLTNPLFMNSYQSTIHFFLYQESVPWK